VNAKWLKSDLTFNLCFAANDECPDIADVTLKGSFKLRNRTHDNVPFRFIIEVEVAPGEKDKISGRFAQTDEVTKLAVTELLIELSAVGHSSIRRYSRTFNLSPTGEYRFEWVIDRYSVQLPYCEFWASAHPLVNMSLSVQDTHGKLVAETIAYRPAELGEQDDTKKTEDIYKVELPGAFLPYQGVFMRVTKKGLETKKRPRSGSVNAIRSQENATD
jgi:hypothetical protein